MGGFTRKAASMALVVRSWMRTQPSRAAVASMEPSGDTARAFRPFRLTSNTAAGILPLLPLPDSLWLSSSIIALACTHDIITSAAWPQHLCSELQHTPAHKKHRQANPPCSCCLTCSSCHHLSRCTPAAEICSGSERSVRSVMAGSSSGLV